MELRLGCLAPVEDLHRYPQRRRKALQLDGPRVRMAELDAVQPPAADAGSISQLKLRAPAGLPQHTNAYTSGEGLRSRHNG